MADSSVHLIFKVKQYQNANFAKVVYYGKTRTQVKIIIVSRRGKCLYSKWDLSHKFIFTAHKQIWGKVMFLHLSVILFMGGGRGRGNVCPISCKDTPPGTPGRYPLPSTTGYGQQADSTHPTGMHTYLLKWLFLFEPLDYIVPVSDVKEVGTL